MGFMYRPSTMDPGSRLLGEPLSAAASQLLPPGGARAMWHPTPLSTLQRDSLTDPRHLWVEGLVPPLEIPSLKPARICTSRSRGRRRSGLGSVSAAQRTFCERFAGPSVGGGTRVATGDSVPQPSRISFPWCCCRGRAALLFPPRRPIPSAKDPPREVCRSLWNRNLPRSNIPWSLGAEFALG